MSSATKIGFSVKRTRSKNEEEEEESIISNKSSTELESDISIFASRDFSINAVSSVLNNPQYPHNKLNRISRNDLPVFKETKIPQIKYQQFNNYLHQISDLMSSYVQNQKKKILSINHKDETSMKDNVSEYSKAVDNGDSESQYSLDNSEQQLAYLVEDFHSLSSVPEIFLKEKFMINDSSFFNELFDLNDLTSDAFNNTLLNNQLQETFGHYLDIVEVHLTREISLRSKAFFRALSTLQILETETSDCIEEIEQLRKELSHISESQCNKALDVIRLKKNKDNHFVLYKCIKMITDIKYILPTIHLILSYRDSIGALELINQTHEMISSYKSQFSNFWTEDNDRKETEKIMEIPSLYQPLSFNRIMSGLTTAHSFAILKHHLDISIQKIAEIAQSEFVKIVIADMHTMISIGNQNSDTLFKSMQTTELPRLTCFQPNIIQEHVSNLVNHLNPVLSGLLKLNQLDQAFSEFRNALIEEMANIILQYDPSFELRSDKDSSSKDFISPELSPSTVRSLPFDKFMSYLTSVYISLLQMAKFLGIVRTSVITSIKKEFTSDPLPISQSYQSPETIKSNLDKLIPSLDKEFDDISQQFLHAIHLHCSKQLGLRSDTQVNLTEFYRFFVTTSSFIIELEECLGKQCLPLRGSLISQAKTFLNVFHSEKLKKLAVFIENDQWSHAQVPVEFQVIVNRIVESSSGIESSNTLLSPKSSSSSQTLANPVPMPSPLIIPFKTFGAEPLTISERSISPSIHDSRCSIDSLPPVSLSLSQQDDQSSIRSHTSNQHNDNSSKSNTVLIVNDQKFHVVGCALLLLQIIVEYLQCCANFQPLAIESLIKLIEILKLFNSRTCQMILGAGAMHSAGLKNITARHIALAAQSLSVIVALIPYIKEFVRNNPSTKLSNLVLEFDKVTRDLLNHQDELYFKLVSIMSERADFHVKNLHSIKWDELESNKVCPFMETIIKEIRTLHKVLQRYLPSADVNNLMAKIAKMYCIKIEEKLLTLQIHSNTGKQRLLFNIKFFSKQIEYLNIESDFVSHLEYVIEHITIRFRKIFTK